MTLYDRYISGQTEQVCQKILTLEKEVFSNTYRSDVDHVLRELFSRIADNVNIIYAGLKSIIRLIRAERNVFQAGAIFNTCMHKRAAGRLLFVRLIENICTLSTVRIAFIRCEAC
jgi:hypothetical protein